MKVRLLQLYKLYFSTLKTYNCTQKEKMPEISMAQKQDPQDILVDDIEKSLGNLHTIAVDQGKELKEQMVDLDKADFELGVSIDKMAKQNNQLDQIDQDQPGLNKRCLVALLILAFLFLFIYLFAKL